MASALLGGLLGPADGHLKNAIRAQGADFDRLRTRAIARNGVTWSPRRLIALIAITFALPRVHRLATLIDFLVLMRSVLTHSPLRPDRFSIGAAG